MARKPKTYSTLAHPYLLHHPETGERLHRQVRMAILTTTQKDAARQMGLRYSDFKWNGGETGNAPTIEACAANPGRVLVWPKDSGPDRLQFFVAPEEWQRKNVERLIADEEARARRKIEDAERDAEWAAQRERNAQADRAAREMIEREADILEDLGLHLTTDGRGNCTLPVETIIGLAMQALR